MTRASNDIFPRAWMKSFSVLKRPWILGCVWLTCAEKCECRSEIIILRVLMETVLPSYFNNNVYSITFYVYVLSYTSRIKDMNCIDKNIETVCYRTNVLAIALWRSVADILKFTCKPTGILLVVLFVWSTYYQLWSRNASTAFYQTEHVGFVFCSWGHGALVHPALLRPCRRHKTETG